MMNKFLTRCSLLLATATVACAQTLLLNETFTYPDGGLVAGSGGVWTNFSGTAGQLNVVGGQLEVTGTESEDAAAVLSATAITSGTLSATFTLTMTALPNGAGTYFMMFKDSGTTNFRGRLFAQTTGAAAGTFRLGISSSSTTTIAQFGQDLSLNTAYSVTFTLDPATGASTLSIDGGAAVANTDTPSALGVTTIGIRQSANEGTMLIDNLVVNLVAIPEPSTIALGLVGLAGMVALRRRK